MDSVKTSTELRDRVRMWRMQNSRVAFVPTMGNLHAGHLRLVRHARALADYVVVSIFVNPMQFGANEDYESYPLTYDLDKEALMEEDADLLFAPNVSEMYPQGIGQTTQVVVPGLNAILEGKHRPSHFNGVTTVVAKLFNMVQPDIAVFGEKDFQQLLIVRHMVTDLCLPVDIEAVETVREADGLAMSSRNHYLQPVERSIAPQLYQTLLDVKYIVQGGEDDLAGVEQTGLQQLAKAGFEPQYVSIRRAPDLLPPEAGDHDLVVLAAAVLGTTRLIDNVRVSIT
jgi:pantoate--beta-alanine ligase